VIDKATGKEALRFRAYYWLLNISFVFVIVGFADILTRFVVGEQGYGLEGLAVLILNLLFGIFGFFLPFFLMVARFMRDDYMEGLWKRTVVVLAYSVAVLPLALFIFAWTVELGLPRDTSAYTIWRQFYEPFINNGQRGVVIVTAVWQHYLWLFICIFQFLRWRDSR